MNSTILIASFLIFTLISPMQLEHKESEDQYEELFKKDGAIVFEYSFFDEKIEPFNESGGRKTLFNYHGTHILKYIKDEFEIINKEINFYNKILSTDKEKNLAYRFMIPERIFSVILKDSFFYKRFKQELGLRGTNKSYFYLLKIEPLGSCKYGKAESILKKFNSEENLSLVEYLIDSVKIMHDNESTHLDIKQSNVLLREINKKIYIPVLNGFGFLETTENYTLTKDIGNIYQFYSPGKIFLSLANIIENQNKVENQKTKFQIDKYFSNIKEDYYSGSLFILSILDISKYENFMDKLKNIRTILLNWIKTAAWNEQSRKMLELNTVPKYEYCENLAENIKLITQEMNQEMYIWIGICNNIIKIYDEFIYGILLSYRQINKIESKAFDWFISKIQYLTIKVKGKEIKILI